MTHRSESKFILPLAIPGVRLDAVADLEILKGGFSMAHTQRTAEGGAQSCDVAIRPRKAWKIFLRVLFSNQEALS